MRNALAFLGQQPERATFVRDMHGLAFAVFDQRRGDGFALTDDQHRHLEVLSDFGLREQQIERGETPLTGADPKLRLLRARPFDRVHDEILHQSIPHNCPGQRLDAGGCLFADIQR
ncbi:hypothetical protein [Paraburkholderia sediminicola]